MCAVLPSTRVEYVIYGYAFGRESHCVCRPYNSQTSDRRDLDAGLEPIPLPTVGRAVQEDGLQRLAQEEEPGLQVHIHAGRA